MPKPLKHFTTNEIDYFLESGDMPAALAELLEAALIDAKSATDGCVAVQFFIDHELDEEETE
jgi:hypothetical protein